MENQKDCVETQWWNDEVAEAVKVKQALYRNWPKESSKDSWEKYKESKRYTKKTILLLKENKQREFASDLISYENQNQIFPTARQTVKERQDVTA